ncbi:MAG: winged helix-turn-helix domain-containing protein [Thermoplasmatota archaeon]
MAQKENEISYQIRILMFLMDDIRGKIIDMLYDSGSHGASFKTMKERLGIPPTSLAYHLNVLVKENIIEKEFLNVEGRRDYSFYNLREEAGDAYLKALAYLGSQSADHERTREAEQEIWIIPLRLGPRVISLEHI